MPIRPLARCAEPQCRRMSTKRGRCEEHQPQPWAGRGDKATRYGISSGSWRALKAKVGRRDHGCCYLCGDAEDDSDDEDDTYVLDHITPVAEGGSVTDLDNLGLLCPPCDEVKSKAEAARGNARRLERRRRPA